MARVSDRSPDPAVLPVAKPVASLVQVHDRVAGKLSVTDTEGSSLGPALAATMLAYLTQISLSMRPNTIRSAEADLRIFTGFVIGHDPALSCAVDIERSHVEAFKIWQRAQPGRSGKPFKDASFRRRLSVLKMFFIRIIEWEWDDAPARVPIFFGG